MKKLLLATFILAMVSCQPATAGLWDVVSGMTKETVKSTAYTVESSGANLRVYEWETPTGKVCTSVITDNKGIAMDCDWSRK